jgi:hypothetical protein
MIPPEFSDLYDWTFQDSPDTATLIITFPPTFVGSSIRHQLSPDHTAIAVEWGNEVPLVKGTLFAPVTSVNASLTENSFSLTLTKATAGDWPLPITNFYPETEEIDPQSGFLVYCYAKEGTPIGAGNPAMCLGASIDAGFCPALRVAFEAFSVNPQTAAQGFRLLSVAAQTYGDPIAWFMIGQVLEERGGAVEQAFGAFEKAAGGGWMPAAAVIGQYFSPLCERKFPEKDVRMAIKIFEGVRKVDPTEPVSAHELAMLYFNGVGVEKDVERANELQKIAVAGNPEIGPLTMVGDEWHAGLLLGLALVAVGAAGIFTLVKVFRRR